MKKLLVLFILFFISCSKENISGPTFKLIVLASKGGNVTFGNPNDGRFKEGTQITITAVPDDDYFFIGWIDGSRDNPLILTLDTDTEIAPKFLNKQDLITRFLEIVVVGQGANGGPIPPPYSRKWKKEIKIFLDGNPSDLFKSELELFLEELNNVVDNNTFSAIQVNDKSSSNVHMVFTEPDKMKDYYPTLFGNINIESYTGYVRKNSDSNGNIFEGVVFMNALNLLYGTAYSVSTGIPLNTRIIRIIRHELCHILGFKHTTDKTSIMYPGLIYGQNTVYSDLDKEVLRFLYDERIPSGLDAEESRKILENILGVN